MAVTANTSIDVTPLAYNELRESLKSFLSRQSRLQDYNFEGSTVSLLLDMLALSTYNMAFYDNMSLNEGFITTAVLRDSVVSRGTALGYTPRSATGARAVLRLTIVPDDDPDYITVTKGTKFEATIDGRRFIFETVQDYVLTANDDGIYQTDITIAQGITVTERYTVTGDAPHRYTLLNANIDTSSLTVVVKPSAASTDQEVYTRHDDLTEIMSDTLGFFLEGDIDSKYTLQFGDGVIGRALVAGEQVVCTYRVTDGIVANDAAVFRALNNPGGYSVFSFAVVTRAAGGADAETREGVAYSAPRHWERQKRLVIDEDYEEFLKNRYPEFESVSVWGGEKNDPPVYGRVFISIKPYNAYTITQTYKDEIFRQIDERNVQAIEPVFVDPTYIFIEPTVRVFYDSTRTTLNAEGIFAKVQDAIVAYEASIIGDFRVEFMEFSFTEHLKNSDASISNIEVDYKLQKRFVPILNSVFSYTTEFSQPIDHPLDNNPLPVLSSTGFTIPSNANKMFLDDDGAGGVRVYYLKNGLTRVYVNTNAGTIDYETGTVVLRNLAMSSVDNSELHLSVVPRYQSFQPVRNQILLFSNTTISIWRTSVSRAQPASFVGSVTTQGSDQLTLDSVTGF